MSDSQKSSNILVSYGDFAVGEKVIYLVKGRRFEMVAIFANITRHPLSEKSIVFDLTFLDETLPQHLQTQPITFPQNAAWIEKAVNF